MKTKISKFLGVGLALIMVLSLAFALVPTKAEAAPMLWTPEANPGQAGTNTVGAFDVDGMAVGPDGATIYVIDNQPAGVAADQILQSTNGGRTFAALITAAGIAAQTGVVATGPFRCIAVAPDNPNVLAVVDSFAVAATNALGRVYVSRDAGVNWIALPVTPDAGAVAGGNRVMDLAIGPARATAAVLDGRDFMVCTADDVTVLQNDGDIFVIGQNLAWQSCQTAATYAANTYDFMSVSFSTGFIGDRVIVAVGARGSAAPLGTALILINLGAGWGGATSAYVAPPAGPVLIQATPIDWTTAAVGNSITSADIALPTTGFDPTIPGGQRVWVGLAAQLATGNTDVFRVDFTTVRKLGIATDVDINSIAYSGDYNNGTLIAGASNLAGGAQIIQTWYTNDPGVAFPTWIGSAKSPTGTANAFVACAPDFPSSKKVFAGTSDAATAGNESAFSYSVNGGISFNQSALIDTAINGFCDVQITPDGKTLFLSTWNAATGAALESLWMSPVPPTAGSWDRIRISPISWGVLGGAAIRLNPDYTNAPVLYWVDLAAAGIQYSSDGGSTFVPRNTFPAAGGIGDVAVESATVLYASQAAGVNVYRSDSSAWNFNVGPVNAGVGPAIYSLAMAPSYPLLPTPGHLLVGGTGATVNFSVDSANPGSFGPPAGTGLAGTATNMQVVADTNYATNNTIYAGDGTAVAATGNFIYRWVIGTSTQWEPISAAAAAARAVYGLAATNGILYAAWDTGLATAPSGADRSLNPTGVAGTIQWDFMTAGAAGGATFAAVPSALRIDATPMPTLYAIDTTVPLLLSYLDNMATAVTTLSAPAGGATVPIDPASGRALPVMFSWEPMGFGPGLANIYEIQIAEQGSNFAALVATNFFSPTGAAVVGPPAIAAHIAGLNPTSPSLTAGPAGAIWVVNLVAGHNYEWRIRARDEVSGDVLRSNWSASSAFSVEAGVPIQAPYAGPILNAPALNATAGGVEVGLSWGPMAGVTEYQVLVATDSALTALVAGTPATVTTSSFGPVTLNFDTVYYYGVQATSPTQSVMSTGSFTMAAPVVPPPPVEIPPAQVISPAWIWAVVIIGAILVIAVIFLIVSTRRAS